MAIYNATWVASLVLCFLLFESLDVVYGNIDATSLLSLKTEWENTPPNWEKTNDPCGSPGWEGITCKNSRVTEVKLSSMNLKGTLSGDIGGLTELISLDLSYNKGLNGPITSSIGQLKKLETLILLSCSFSGAIPPKMGDLTELYYLALNSNNFNGNLPEEMGNLSKLYWFDIADNKLSGELPSSLKKLTNTKHFHFGENQFSGKIPPEIFNPSMILIHVLFESNNLEGGIPDSIGFLDKLEVLRLDRNQLTGPVPSITNLTSLIDLNFANNQLTGSLPDLTRMTTLATLDLSNNLFSPMEVPSWLTGLTSLTTLVIESGGMKGEFPSELLRNSLLQNVKLRNNSFNGTLDLASNISSKLKLVDLRESKIELVTIGSSLDFKFSISGSPFCVQNPEKEYCNNLTETVGDYSTNFPCIKPACPQNKSPNPRKCTCAYAYAGILEFRAPSFSDFTDATRFQELESSLWEKLDLLPNSVYIQIQDNPNTIYLEIKVQLFPSEGIYFDRREISRIGFELSNQTYKPPKGFGPFVFHAESYTFSAENTEKASNNNVGIIAGIACGCAGIIVIIIIASIIFVSRKKKGMERINEPSHNFEGWGGEKTKDSGPAPQLKGAKWFSFDDLRKYTNDFSVINEIGSGGYGKVYKGLLPNGQLVAIKRAQFGSMQGGMEFKNEIELLSRVHHKNLVSLIGFCFDQKEQILVYEYIPNGTIRESLLGKTGIILDWNRRLKIALGAARGLAYLHEHADPPIVHRDVKSSNILLNENLSAKVADFGLSKLMPDIENGHVSTQVKGTIGYVDPEYYMTQHLTEKSDVYSFGVVMMELITAKQPIQRGLYIVRLMRQLLNKDDEIRGLSNLMDPLIRNAPNLFGFGKFVDLALKCVEEGNENRPHMYEVVREIELILQNNGSDLASATSLGSDFGASRHIPHPYNADMLHRRENDSSGDANDSSTGLQMTYNVQPK